MENVMVLPYISLGKLPEITSGKCGQCKKKVDGVDKKYYCPNCGHVGTF